MAYTFTDTHAAQNHLIKKTLSRQAQGLFYYTI